MPKHALLRLLAGVVVFALVSAVLPQFGKLSFVTPYFPRLSAPVGGALSAMAVTATSSESISWTNRLGYPSGTMMLLPFGFVSP